MTRQPIMTQEPIELLSGTHAALAAGFDTLEEFERAANIFPLPPSGYRHNGQVVWADYNLREWRRDVDARRVKGAPREVTYTITAMSGEGLFDPMKHEFIGPFDKLTEVIFGHMTGSNASKYEIKTNRGFLYWNTNASDLDPVKPGDVQQAEERGLVYDPSAMRFVEVKRRGQSAEELRAYATEALVPNYFSSVEVARA